MISSVIDFFDFNNTISRCPRLPEIADDPTSRIVSSMVESGLTPPERVVVDGCLHRFDIDRTGDMAGWYIFFSAEKFVAGAYGSWKSDLKVKFSSVLEKIDTDDYRGIIAKAKQAQEKERANLQQSAKERAERLWDHAFLSDSDHPYLKKKGVTAYGIRASGNDIIIPAYDAQGSIHTVQRISPDGTKRFLFGGRKKGCFFTIQGSPEFYICEGYATGATVHAATGGTVIVAFDAGNILPVMETIRRHNPSAQLTICADNDQFAAKNPGVKAATEAGNRFGARIVIPQFQRDQLSGRPTDFNDLMILAGIDAVRQQLSQPMGNQPLHPWDQNVTRVRDRVKSAPPPMEYIVTRDGVGMIPRGKLGIVTATGGTGKGYFLLNLAYILAGGYTWGPLAATRQHEVLYVSGEDDQEEVDRRLWKIGKGVFPEKLYSGSTVGQIGPLMTMEKGVPKRTEAFDWLEKTIRNHQGLEVLFIDPLSRFYGLDENNSSHGTQFIGSLEYLSMKYSLSIIVAHHTSKTNSKDISQEMGRGTAAFADGFRFQAGMVTMSEETGKLLGVNEHWDYVIFQTPKSNYSPKNPNELYFHRMSDGVLEAANLGSAQISRVAEMLLEILTESKIQYSVSELNKGKIADPVIDELRAEIPGFVRVKHIQPAMQYLFQKQKIRTVEIEVDGNKRLKKVIEVVI